MVRFAGLVSALALVLALGCQAWAGPPTETLNETVTTVNRLLDDPALRDNPAKLLAAVRKVVTEGFDVRQAARLALGREWDARSSTERDEFVHLFGGVLEQAYISRIASLADVRRGLAMRYHTESVEGDQATVATTIESRDGNAIPLVYRMVHQGQRWAVYDVLIDGISLVVNYRAQLHRIIQRSSYAELVARLKTKTWSQPTTAAAVSEPPAPATAPRPAPRVEVSAPTVQRHASVDAIEVIRRAPVDSPASVPPANQMAASYWIQLGAFANQAAADVATRLLEQSLPLAIDAVAPSAGPRGALLLRVRVGPFADRAAAASRLLDLQTKGYRPVLAYELD